MAKIEEEIQRTEEVCHQSNNKSNLKQNKQLKQVQRGLTKEIHLLAKSMKVICIQLSLSLSSGAFKGRGAQPTPAAPDERLSSS